MYRTLQYAILFVVLVLLQVFLFSRIGISIYVHPLVYIAFILLLPIEIAPLPPDSAAADPRKRRGKGRWRSQRQSFGSEKIHQICLHTDSAAWNRILPFRGPLVSLDPLYPVAHRVEFTRNPAACLLLSKTFFD